nr:MAG TPA: hypothetical protein [Caudoviricetes sp.]DAW73423.1 MAG TPA: hypothetical protein [Caudoviricetes sp.]
MQNERKLQPKLTKKQRELRKAFNSREITEILYG